jgi:ABC-type phosphate transport system substrate-binding protein
MKPQHFIAMAILALVSSAASAQVAVIVNPKNPTAAMTADDVSALYLGKSKALPGGGTAVLADLAEGSPASELFYDKATGKTGAQVKSIWSRLTFSGKGTPPKVLASSAEVKQFVAANPDAIGYIEKSAVDGTVKVVLSIDK